MPRHINVPLCVCVLCVGVYSVNMVSNALLLVQACLDCGYSHDVAVAMLPTIVL